MAWYVVFQGCNPGVYDSWGICNDQVLGFRGASYLSYHTQGQAEAAYAAFVDHEKQKLRPQVLHVLSGKQVPEIWTWKDIVISVQLIVIIVQFIVLCYLFQKF
jgi:hypothetical protein